MPERVGIQVRTGHLNTYWRGLASLRFGDLSTVHEFSLSGDRNTTEGIDPPSRFWRCHGIGGPGMEVIIGDVTDQEVSTHGFEMIGVGSESMSSESLG
jgi:hypothetical protein